MKDLVDTPDMVVGFAFDETLKNIALIRKNKPEWQKGKLNGIGGKVRRTEDYHEAVTREFKEETGVTIERWKTLAVFTIQGVYLYFFYVILETSLFSKIKSMTDEKVVIADVNNLPPIVIQNLRWLIPMCLDDWIEKPVRINCPNLKKKARESFEA